MYRQVASFEFRVASFRLLASLKHIFIFGCGQRSPEIMHYELCIKKLSAHIMSRELCFYKCLFNYSAASSTTSSFFFERMMFVMMPRMSAQAISVRVTLPMLRVIPPIPLIRITATTKRFLFWSRSTF